ncbi:hypothetical protein [Streptomyces albipurpureus]|uniref:DUF7919 domain-containing protein n=1 Tax=Streptomyces albipurpureus TaxID=2897419 RepID=A0ABT0UXC7_9ACTN|nr:hypothetical protein [Streptomyces sp. CWNU-1]MCM2393120.1 hypothetical protein [Streptomyces sp. CWNU-1]
MTYFEDLTPYSYFDHKFPAHLNVLSVGWLESGKDFTVGETPAEFHRKLMQLIEDYSIGRTRGWHGCTLPHGEQVMTYPCSVRSGGRTVTLGSAEVGVVGAGGVIMVAPNLIYHYVTDHLYLPPSVFVEAVLEGNFFETSASILD